MGRTRYRRFDSLATSLWLALRVALARDAKMRPAFSGSGTIFKEPASGGFLRLWGEPVIEG
ncbi:hypothetical protein, partial [Pantoea sp. Ft-CA_14]|uniref:hypothetical protein n=1 Tax=Pantoea sp. Ft-CA_14 TaxID=2929507 RepID=UPI002118CBD3